MIAPANPNPEPEGGLGGVVDPANGIRDVRLLERAVRKGWNIPEQLFDVLPGEMAIIALDRGNSHRERISATKAIVSMHGQNQKDQHHEEGERHLHLHAHAAVEAAKETVSQESIVARLREEAEHHDTNGNGNGHG
jgi:hypothetical protein